MSVEQSYYEWHNGPTHKPVHWGVFIIVGVLLTGFLLTEIHRTYLSDLTPLKAEASALSILNQNVDK